MATDTKNDAKGGSRLWPWALLACGLLALGAGGYFWLTRSGEEAASAAPPAAPLVQVARLEATDTVVLSQTGFVRAVDAVDVTPQLSERIITIGENFAVGAHMAEGDLIVRLDPATALADLRAANARLDQAETALEGARQSLARQRELADENVVSAAALDAEEVAFSRAQGEYSSAQSDVSRATIALGNTELRAPFDAIVTAESASIGQLVSPGAAIGRLIATDAVEIRMGLLPSAFIGLGPPVAAIGRTVTIRDAMTGEVLRDGTVAAVEPDLNPQSRTIGLIVRVEDPFAQTATTLRTGTLVSMDLPLPLVDGPALRLPVEALKGGSAVWAVNDGTLSRAEATILSRTGDTVTLRAEGLSPGDSVLLSDLAALVDGDTVRVAQDPDHIAEGG